MANVVRLRVFGGLRLWRDGVEVDVGPVRQRIVLALLLAARGAVVSTAELVDILWGESPSASAVNPVHRLIGQVRRLFEPDLPNREPGGWVQPVGDGYQLRVDGRTCDLVAFFELAAAARKTTGPAATQRFEQALEAARDEPFAGLPPSLFELPAFVAVATARTEVAVAAADLALDQPSAHRLLPLIIRYAAAAPLHEPLQARLIRLFTAAGRRAEALVHFEQLRQRLADDLGADPGAELSAAHLAALTDPAAPVAHRPAQLPQRVTAFAPRDDLVAALDAGRGAGVIVLSGMGGAGKTSLAVDWTHRIAADFPDGQLHLNLRGFDAGERQLQPAEALNMLLESIGIDPAVAGDSVDIRAARFRSALADRRMVVLLDNARDSEQVRPLLPGSAGCLVIVTSRNRLPGLVAHEGAWPVHVGRLNRAAARGLLVRRLGPARLADEPAATDDLIRLCAGLPLALSIAAARVAVSPETKLTDVVTDLGSAAHRLDALATGERNDDVRSAFSWSYAVLSEPAARLFRMLAAHPGPDISAGSAASIAGGDIRGPLAELSVLNMVTPLSAVRFTVHDLLQEYAAELLGADADERAAAERRTVEHYVYATRNAYRTFGLAPPAELAPPPPGVAPPEPADHAAAMSWYAGERATVTGAVELALARGWARDAALIVLHLRPLRSARMESTLDSRDQTLRVLRAVGDLGGGGLETRMLREAAVNLYVADPRQAREFLVRALALAERDDDPLEQAQVLRNLGELFPAAPEAEQLGFLRRSVAAARRADSP
ncbi:MAG: BTAD domain-containing putative transcriptional regulator, partial [Actinoplanes sp.]